jgi:hypothetical protein
VAHTNLVAVTATPVTTSDELYDAYLRFLAEPGSLQVSDCPPPHGAAHICTVYQKKYYWVPVTYQALFFDLSAIVTAQRGRSLTPPDPYYHARIVGRPSDEPTALYLINSLSFEKDLKSLLAGFVMSAEIRDAKVVEKALVNSASPAELIQALSNGNGALAKKMKAQLEQDKAGSKLLTTYLMKVPEFKQPEITAILGGPQGDGTYLLLIRFDKMLPAEKGTIIFGPQSGAAVQPYQPDPDKISFKTTDFKLYLDQNRLPLGLTTPEDLYRRLPLEVDVDSETHKPAPPTTKDLLNRIPFHTPQVQFDTKEVPVLPSTAQLIRPMLLPPQAVADAK